MNSPSVVVLVGPSGSGKTAIARKLLEKLDCFEKLKSYTTHATAANNEWYYYVPEDAFRVMCESGEIFESTTYAHNFYGSKKSDVEKILAEGKHVLTVMDICGAMALKTHFENVITVYVKREKRELLTSIVQRDMSVEEKVNRLLAIEAEKQNAQICDFVVKMDDADRAVEELCQNLHISLS